MMTHAIGILASRIGMRGSSTSGVMINIPSTAKPYEQRIRGHVSGIVACGGWRRVRAVRQGGIWRRESLHIRERSGCRTDGHGEA